MYSLYPYQENISKKGQKILMKYNMLYLALEMRSGKTPISLDVIKNTDPEAGVLFVTTKSAIDGIRQAYEDFGFTMNIKVINYQSLHKIHEDAVYTHIIIDEAHKNISSFPRPSKSWKQLKKLIKEDTKIIYLSGTTHIESSSQLFHQLSLSPFHSFSQYRGFYEWFNPKGHYKDSRLTGGYGIPGTRFIGYGKEAADYSHTHNFESKFKPIMIKHVMDNEEIKPHIEIVWTVMKVEQKMLYHQMKTTGVTGNPFSIAANAAGRMSKCQQIASGTLIGEDDTYILSQDKAYSISRDHPNVPVFYKYKAEYDILSEHIDESLLYQIDSQNTGLDLSQYDSMVIYSLTYSGANWSQVLARLTNTERTTKPTVYVYLVEGTLDKDIYETVSNKRDANTKFLKE